MDYSSANSELLESLDFLRPPVKRIVGSVNKRTSVKLGSHPKPIELLKDFRKKFTNSTQYPSPKISGAQSSTSLISERPTDAEILDQNLLLNYLSQHSKSNTNCAPIFKEKPLIRVTVTPNYTPTANAPRKRKYLAKKIQTTKSNHENSIRTRNVYLVVPRSKREKVYQIKTTESAKLPSDHSFNHATDEVIPIEQLSSLQLVLDSLNMENRREKSKKRKQKASPNRENFMKTSGVYDGYINYRDCTCPNAVQGDKSPDVTPRKSFVRITGHLGLTEDDRYVLRCAATVNDKHVATNFCGVENTSPISSRREPRFFALQKDANSRITQCYNTIPCNYSQKRHSNIQTDLQNINSNKEAEKKAADMLCKESQATQVDFNMDFSQDLEKYKGSVPFKDEIIQCCCTNALKSESNSDTNNCQSPLVIISVYPDCCENPRVIEYHQKDNKDFSRRMNINENPNFKQRPPNEKSNVNDKNKDTRPRSRSPSPVKNQNKSRPIFAETKILRMTTRKNSSPIREVATAFPRRQPPINIDGKNGKSSSLERNKERSPRLDRRKETQGTNTDHNITKKIIVDNYTKKLTAYMNNDNVEKKFSFPKTNPSKIAVNIDGDNEFYDVLFQQGHATTDLKVKKTIKGSNKKRTADFKDKSLKNYVALPEQLRNRDTPQAITRKEQLNDAPSLKNAFARLQVRDSLEISHRHDTKTVQNQNKQASKNSVESSAPFSAPIKHYRGDSCPIPDPMARDKEIRTLLGIDKGVHTSISRDYEVDKKKFATPLHYIYKRTGKKKVTGINLMEMPLLPPCVCCDIKTKYLTSTYECGCTAKNQQWPSPEPSLAKIPTANSSFQSVNLNTNSSAIYYQVKGKEATSFNFPSSSVVEGVDLRISNIKSKFPRKSTGGNNIGTQYEKQVQHTSLYQQLILNRNVQVFLQVEQFSKQKPIILSRKQYDKVRRAIENTIANKTGKRKKYICKTSLVSVGDVRRRNKTDETLHFDKQNQTDKNVLLMKTTMYSSQAINASLVSEKPFNASLASNQSRQSVEMKKSMNKSTNAIIISNSSKKECEYKMPSSHTMVHDSKVKIVNDITQRKPVPPTHAASTRKVRYTSMSFMNHVTFSSTNAEACSTTQEKESHSVHTIFKGRRKCHTPNLGTSVCSLCSIVEPSEKQTPPLAPQESKRKPFLRRLISCLVMRSERASDLNNALLNTPEMMPSVDSSFDSYYINTSLGAIEMTSSIYDTSASFYSNHSVYPVNSKIKRVGFFTSVREFLTSRKS